MFKEIDFSKMPITDVVDEIIYNAAKNGTSDIHFDPTESTVKVRYRIDGVLVDYIIVPENIRKNLIARLKIISGMDITESRQPQDGAIKTTIKDIDLDMRVSSLPTNEGEKIVIRILDYTSAMQGIESLGFSDKNLDKVKQLMKEPNGIILVTGATGSGKSTTVYSILQKLNTSEVNLITVEDPVEMGIDGINQVQVNSDVGLTFANALRSILRQDPDVIMIGEIRDDETAGIAVRASITGHLVLSTLHTNNALNTIERLTDMNVERYLLASSLNGVISQKLARRICPHCRKTRPTIDYEKKLFKANLGIDVNELTYGEGCSNCVKGYKGRVPLHEVLVISQEIRDAIANNMSKDNLRNLVYSTDTKTLLQDGLEKVVKGITTIEEVLRVVEIDDENQKILLNNGEAVDNNVSENNIQKNEETKPVETSNTITNQVSASTPTQVVSNNIPVTPVTTNMGQTTNIQANPQPVVVNPVVSEPINSSIPNPTINNTVQPVNIVPATHNDEILDL